MFNQQPSTYPSDNSRVAFVSSLLSDRAAAWASAATATNPMLCSNFQAFLQEMRKVFDHPVKGRKAVNQLLSLKHCNQSVEYSVSFRILAAETEWNQVALQGVFLKGLSEEVKDELAIRDETASLDTPNLWLQASFTPPRPQWEQVSSSWKRKTRLFALALITRDLTR